MLTAPCALLWLHACVYGKAELQKVREGTKFEIEPDTGIIEKVWLCQYGIALVKIPNYIPVSVHTGLTKNYKF